MNLAIKDPQAAITYSINWRKALVNEAVRETEFAADAVVQPQRTTGFYYKCTVAGMTALRYPNWGRAENEQFNDGSVTWLTIRPEDAAVPTIQSAVWTVPAGLVKDAQTEDDTHAHVTLSGGVHGVDYMVLCRITPTAGNPIERTITVKVRNQ